MFFEEDSLIEVERGRDHREDKELGRKGARRERGHSQHHREDSLSLTPKVVI